MTLQPFTAIDWWQIYPANMSLVFEENIEEAADELTQLYRGKGIKLLTPPADPGG